MMNPACCPLRRLDSADALDVMTLSAKARFASHRPYREALAAKGFRVDEDGEYVNILDEQIANTPVPTHRFSRLERIGAWLRFQFDRSYWAKSKREAIATHYAVERLPYERWTWRRAKPSGGAYGTDEGMRELALELNTARRGRRGR